MSAKRFQRVSKHRVLRVVLGTVIALGAVLAAMWLLVVPVIVHDRIDRVLQRFEHGTRGFVVESISFGAVRLGDVRLGSYPWLRASQVNVRFSLAQLLRGEIESLDIHDAAWRVSLHEGTLDWGPRPSPSRTAPADPIQVPISKVQVRNSKLTLDLGHVVLTAMVSLSAESDGVGRLNGQLVADETRFDGARFSGFTGDLAFDGSVVSGRFRWPLIETAPLTVELERTISGPPEGTGNDFVEFHQPPFALENAAELFALIPGLQDAEIAGRGAVDGSINWPNGATEPLITVRAADVVLAHPDWPLALASASAVIAFDSLSPVRTRGASRVLIDSATTGEIDITNAQALIELSETGVLGVRELRWEMSDGGEYSASPLEIDFNHPRVATHVSAKNISLDYWLRLLTSDRADGSGRLRGEFSVDWNPHTRPRIQFTSGSLVATPPTGFVRVHDASMLRTALEQSDSRFAVDVALRTVKENIIDALQDLGFTKLGIQFVADGRETTLRASVEGQGRRGERAQQFSELVVNIGRFAESLQHVLDATAASEGLERLLKQPRGRHVPPIGMPPPDRP